MLKQTPLFIFVMPGVIAYISPPIAAVFLIGVLWPRANARGALAALLSGLVLGLGRLVLELNRASLTGWAEWLATINFLHFAILLFVVCSAVLVLVSLWTAAPDRTRVDPLTVHGYRHPHAARAGDVAMSAVVISLVVVAWIAFS